MATKTLKLRIKDKHAKSLNKQAIAVNYVWNYVNQLSHTAITRDRKFLSHFDICRYTSGSSKQLGIGSQSIQEIGKEYVTRRNQFKKSKLRWRKSSGVGKSLGWIPFTNQQIKYQNGQIFFNGQYYSLWDSCQLGQYQLRSGSFNQDARGRWYINIAVQIEQTQTTNTQCVGIDLGCKSTATDSNGDGITGHHYRALQQKLGIAQRAGNKKQVRSIHAKIKNKRKDELHKYTRRLVDNHGAVYVGNVDSRKLVKTKMAKSVLDASWGSLKAMLEYKCANAGVAFKVVDEKYTTQICSCCGGISPSSPKGRSGLAIREWTCTLCGAKHDRDINAAKNILAVGQGRLAGGIPQI